MISGLVAVAAFAQAPESSFTATLARIRARVVRDLNQLPNYTCLATIERSSQEANSKRFQLVDLVRLEVALVDNTEIFAWPGSRGFELMQRNR